MEIKIYTEPTPACLHMYFMIAIDAPRNFPSGVTRNGICPRGGLPATKKGKKDNESGSLSSRSVLFKSLSFLLNNVHQLAGEKKIIENCIHCSKIILSY